MKKLIHNKGLIFCAMVALTLVFTPGCDKEESDDSGTLLLLMSESNKGTVVVQNSSTDIITGVYVDNSSSASILSENIASGSSKSVKVSAGTRSLYIRHNNDNISAYRVNNCIVEAGSNYTLTWNGTSLSFN